MKNRNSIYQGLSRASIGMLAACMTLTACDKDQEFTPAMPEAKLINGIVPLSGSQPMKLSPKFRSKVLLPV